MPVRPEVRDTQRTLAALDAAHAKAVTVLERAVERRKAAVAAHDRRVAAAQAGVDQTVAAMADQVSVELTAQLLGMDVTAVRRCARSHAQPAAGPGRSDQ